MIFAKNKFLGMLFHLWDWKKSYIEKVFQPSSGNLGLILCDFCKK